MTQLYTHTHTHTHIHIYIYSFSYSFPLWFVTGYWNSSLCYTVQNLILFYLLGFFFKFIYYLFIIYFWLCWVVVSVRGLSLVAASGGHCSSQCPGLLLSRPLLLQSTGSRRAGSVVVAHGPSCSMACGIFPDQGSNPCPLHWQADSQPLRHQGSPLLGFFNSYIFFLVAAWGITINL